MTWNSGAHLSPHDFSTWPSNTVGEKTKDTYRKEETHWFLSHKLLKQAASATGGPRKKSCHPSQRTRHGRQIQKKAGFIISAIFIDKKTTPRSRRPAKRGPPGAPQPRHRQVKEGPRAGPAGPGTHRSWAATAAAPAMAAPLRPHGGAVPAARPRAPPPPALSPPSSLLLSPPSLLWPPPPSLLGERAGGPQGRADGAVAMARAGMAPAAAEQRWVGWWNKSFPVRRWGRPGPEPGLAPGRAHLAAGAQGTSRLRSCCSIAACRSKSCSRVCRLESSWAKRASSHCSLLSTLQNESQPSSQAFGAFCRDTALWAAPHPVLGVLPRSLTTPLKVKFIVTFFWPHLFDHFLVQRS